MTIHLLGVYHCFQTKDYHEFMNYVRDFCRSHGINSIGEEMNYTALSDAKRDKSTIKIVADELFVPHAYCDPDVDERQRLGIVGENKLRYLKTHHRWTDEEFESRKALDNQKKEPIWLERLQEVFVDPMLFVFGIDHLGSFSYLLEASGFGFQLTGKTWTLNDCPQG
jgi:hypothetical protein